MAKHQQDNKMSGKIAIYQIMMAKHQQDDKTSGKMTKHQVG